jgi:hypothetical protein
MEPTCSFAESDDDADASKRARRLWRCFETIHQVVYFSSHTARRTDALGLRGFWMGYFAMRSAPLGRVHPAVVTATFFGFHHGRVCRALPDAWNYTTPEGAIAARLSVAELTLSEHVDVDACIGEAAEMLWLAAQSANTAGRPLAAANQALSRPQTTLGTLWQAATVLREHRGDGHIAALLSQDITPAEAHHLKIAAGEATEIDLRRARGFPERDWVEAKTELQYRRWIDEGGRLTAEGRQKRDTVEEATDRTATQPWRAPGTDSGRVLQVLEPVAALIQRKGLIPRSNPAGLVWQPR